MESDESDPIVTKSKTRFSLMNNRFSLMTASGKVQIYIRNWRFFSVYSSGTKRHINSAENTLLDINICGAAQFLTFECCNTNCLLKFLVSLCDIYPTLQKRELT